MRTLSILVDIVTKGRFPRKEPDRGQKVLCLPAASEDKLQQEAEEQKRETVTRLRKPWFDRFLDKHPYFPAVLSCVSLLISFILFLVALLLRS